MTTRRTVLGALGCATLLPTALAATPATLRDIAASRGVRFGTALGSGPRQFGDPAYRALVARECNVIVAENAMKWKALQPTPGAYRFDAADRMLAWAVENGLSMRGHNLFWQAEKWLPDWIGSVDARGAEQVMRTHVRSVCTHFGTAIASWDVVNEAVDQHDGALRANALTRPLGALAQIDLAFRLAHEYAPHAQLVYNDFMGADAGSARHRAGVLTLLAALRRRGTPVHALGLQSHIGAPGPADMLAWRRFLDEVSGMGIDLLITELDVNDRRVQGDAGARDAAVAAAARAYLDVTLAQPRLRDVLVWGLADHVSWLQTWTGARRTDGAPARPCPYDGDLRAKPLRAAIAAALQAMPPRA